MKEYIVPEDVLQAMVSALGKFPYEQVASVMNQLSKIKEHKAEGCGKQSPPSSE